jgi:hypothetical protein
MTDVVKSRKETVNGKEKRFIEKTPWETWIHDQGGSTNAPSNTGGNSGGTNTGGNTGGNNGGGGDDLGDPDED